MDLTVAKPKNKPAQTFPPRRGQVKIRIFKSIVKSAAAFACSGRGSRRRHDGDGAPPSSTSTTPPIPSGYSSDT